MYLGENYIEQSVDIFYEIFTQEPFYYNWLEKANLRRYFVDTLNTPNNLSYAYFVNDVLIGGCLGYIIDYFKTKQYFIKEIYVDAKFQNKGYGSNMLKEIEFDLKSKSVENINLFTSKNIKAYDFYLKRDYYASESSVYLMKILL